MIDRHVDHCTDNWVVVKAIPEALKKEAMAASTQVVVDAVYGRGLHKHALYRYEKFNSTCRDKWKR